MQPRAERSPSDELRWPSQRSARTTRKWLALAACAWVASWSAAPRARAEEAPPDAVPASPAQAPEAPRAPDTTQQLPLALERTKPASAPAQAPEPPRVEQEAGAPNEAGSPRASGESSGRPAPEAILLADDIPEPLSAQGQVDADGGPVSIKYLLERVVVRGNARVRTRLVKGFVPLSPGSTLDVADPDIEALRYRLLGTGWFDRVDLRLERGRERGWVVLVIEVEERSTLVFHQLALGLGWSVEGAEGKTTGDQPARKAEPYLGLALGETNFLGSGRTLGGQVLVSPDQQGFALSYVDPVVGASRWSLRMRASFVNGQEYFGGDNDVRVAVQCLDDELSRRDFERCVVRTPAAVVDYWRTGLSLGTARDVGSFTRLSLDWHGDYVQVPPDGMPVAASEVRGRSHEPRSRAPIDFAIERGSSYVSMVSLGFSYDKRDSAILPSRGTLAGFTGDLASGLIASDYEFVRLQSSVNHWVSLPWGHVIRTGVFAGAVFGYAPFFHKFFVSDLTDLMPSRILGLNLDHRPAPNLFGLVKCGKAFSSECGTAVAQMRQEELAARADIEYVWPFVRGRRKFLKNADLFALLGLYALADHDDLRLAVPGYDGLSRLPIDLTLDLGVRLDTQMGVFQIGFAKLAWLPVQ